MARSFVSMDAVRRTAVASLPALRRPARAPRPIRPAYPPAAEAGGAPRYMPALDGLRAVAVLAVVAYHLNAGFAPGGLLGVGVFFVLSGYLITDLLVARWERLGRLDLRDFWSRRARRLLPALWTMLVAVTAYVSLFDRAELGVLRGDLLAAVLYLSNWWLTFHHVSYFASFGPPSPLGHLWSLAVEEQFYLLWPLLLAVGLRLMPNRRARLAVPTLALAVASAVAMALVYQPGADPSRAYYGTDTRAFALLVGAALAMLWPSRSLSAAISRRRLLLLDGAGGAGLCALLIMVWRTNEYEPFLYPVGLVLLSLGSAALIAALAHPASRLARILAWTPLRWLGVRSYGIYLWHYPVIVLTTPLIDASTFGPWRALLQLSASVALAALSWRFVEAPVRRGLLGRAWQALWAGWGAEIWRRLSVGQRAAGLGATLIALFAVAGVAGLLPAPVVAGAAAAGAGTGASVAVVQVVPPATPASAPTLLVTRQTVPGGGGGGGHPQATPAPPTPALPTSRTCPSVTAIGDSIMIDAKPYLKGLLPNAYVDGSVGRQLYQAAATVARLRSEGHLGTCVIIELGTNGPFTHNQLVSLLRALGHPERIVLVNTRVPRPWQNAVNQTLAAVAKTYPRTVLVNWFAASARQAGYFWPDGVHLDPSGARAYADLLVRALRTTARTVGAVTP